MIRKIGVLGISWLCLATLGSCEKDFSDVGSSVVNNTKFETGEILLDVEIETIDISESNPLPIYKSVRADNISIGALGDYWLGVYNNDNYKTIEASFVSQLSLATSPRIKDLQPATANGEIDSVFVLDKVVLKLPYKATNTGRGTTERPIFRLDSVLGNKDIATSLKVYRNGTFLNRLDPDNPTKSNSFQSNHDYDQLELLNEDIGFTFKPNPSDTALVLTRGISSGNTYENTIRLANKAPFLTIPLDMEKMKSLFWDKLDGDEFKTTDAFNSYFKGLIVKAEGNNGAMVPLNINGSITSATLDFHYTITRSEKQEGITDLVFKDNLPKTISYSLSGVRNSIYKSSPATITPSANNFTVQGTTGTMARIKILDDVKLQELRANNWLINDALLSFYINKTINTDKNIIPQRLFIYQEKDNGSGSISPTQLSDAYKEAPTFDGNLSLTDDGTPEKYSFRLTDYLSDLLDGTTNDNSPLVLKTYNNPTDNPVINGVLDTNVSTYNWNPRGVTLLDGSETANGTKRAVLKISYTKEK